MNVFPIQSKVKNTYYSNSVPQKKIKKNFLKTK
jgi:hypothetical protein